MIPLLSFLAPTRLWLLLLIPLLVGLYLWMVQRKRNRSKQMSKTMFDLVIPRDRTWLRHLAVGLSILSLLTLTVAFAKPKDQVSVPRERATIVVTIDVSLSMEAQDVDPNRLDAAKTAAEQFVTSLPPKFNVALVTFAGTATTLVPPTLDRGSVTAAIRSLRPQASTAIGEGIFTSLAALAQVPPDPDNPKTVPPARIVLLSDGKTQVGRPSDQAAMAARAQSVPIYTIGPQTVTSTSVAGGSRCRSIGPSWQGFPRSLAGRRTRRRPQASSKMSTRTSVAPWARRRWTEKSPRAMPVSGWASQSSPRSG
jgi:Ca-activated chloride channel homolog